MKINFFFLGSQNDAYSSSFLHRRSPTLGADHRLDGSRFRDSYKTIGSWVDLCRQNKGFRIPTGREHSASPIGIRHPSEDSSGYGSRHKRSFRRNGRVKVASAKRLGKRLRMSIFLRASPKTKKDQDLETQARKNSCVSTSQGKWK